MAMKMTKLKKAQICFLHFYEVVFETTRFQGNSGSLVYIYQKHVYVILTQFNEKKICISQVHLVKTLEILLLFCKCDVMPEKKNLSFSLKWVVALKQWAYTR